MKFDPHFLTLEVNRYIFFAEKNEKNPVPGVVASTEMNTRLERTDLERGKCASAIEGLEEQAVLLLFRELNSIKTFEEGVDILRDLTLPILKLECIATLSNRAQNGEDFETLVGFIDVYNPRSEIHLARITEKILDDFSISDVVLVAKKFQMRSNRNYIVNMLCSRRESITFEEF